MGEQMALAYVYQMAARFMRKYENATREEFIEALEAEAAELLSGIRRV